MGRGERALYDREKWDHERCAATLRIMGGDSYIGKPFKNRAEYVRLSPALIDSDVYGDPMRMGNKDSDVETIPRMVVSPAIVEYLPNGRRYMIGMGAKSDDIRLPIGAATNEAISV